MHENVKMQNEIEIDDNNRKIFFHSRIPEIPRRFAVVYILYISVSIIRPPFDRVIIRQKIMHTEVVPFIKLNGTRITTHHV